MAIPCIGSFSFCLDKFLFLKIIASINFSDNWLCSEKFTIADINLAVLLQRLWELGLEERFWANGKRANIENYFSRVKLRESFKKTIPNLPVHLKMIITSQPPLYVGAAGAVSIGFVFALAYIFKKLIR